MRVENREKEINYKMKKDFFYLFRKQTLNGGSGVYFVILICIEIICLSILLFRGITRPKVELEYATSNFYYNDLSNVKMEDTNLVFSQAEEISNEQVQTVSCNTFSLTSGAYQFYVSYESNTDGNEDYTKSSGSFTLVSNHHEIETETVTFDDGHRQAIGRFWIPAFSHCDDLFFVVRYNGQGTLKICNCKVAEYRRYRAVRFIGFLILFSVLDILYIIFFTDCLIKFNKTIVGLAMVIIFASIPFIDDVVYNGHDLWFHMVRIAAVSQGLAEGQFPVRISTELNNGFGYANSLYYCDIFYICRQFCINLGFHLGYVINYM